VAFYGDSEYFVLFISQEAIMINNYRICRRYIMDTIDQDIEFDENG